MKYIEINQDFEATIKTELTVIDFYADWCGPSRMLAPVVENLTAQFKDNPRVSIAKLDVDKIGAIAAKYGVNTIPTVIFFKNGVEHGRAIGYKPLQYFVDVVNKLVK
jgi:thioredoxin 1